MSFFLGLMLFSLVLIQGLRMVFSRCLPWDRILKLIDKLERIEVSALMLWMQHTFFGGLDWGAIAGLNSWIVSFCIINLLFWANDWFGRSLGRTYLFLFHSLVGIIPHGRLCKLLLNFFFKLFQLILNPLIIVQVVILFFWIKSFALQFFWFDLLLLRWGTFRKDRFRVFSFGLRCLSLFLDSHNLGGTLSIELKLMLGDRMLIHKERLNYFTLVSVSCHTSMLFLMVLPSPFPLFGVLHGFFLGQLHESSQNFPILTNMLFPAFRPRSIPLTLARLWPNSGLRLS